MTTKVNFTINWLYVLLVLALGWGTWVTRALMGAVEAHQAINCRLDTHRSEIGDLQEAVYLLTELSHGRK